MIIIEKNFRKNAKKLAEQESIGALVENFKRELTGGDVITLDTAFKLYLDKPRRKAPSKRQQQINQSQWDDFCAFMAKQYPEATKLDQITKQHAAEYISHLRSNGRYCKKIQYQRKYNNKSVVHSYEAKPSLSGRTVNAFHKTLKSVFSKLQEDAGILYNPFNFEMLDNKSESRDAFTPEELRLIGDNLNPFVKPIFVIGICTGLSEGDICTLQWEDIQNGWITRKRRKTGAELDIPILPPLAKFLSEQKEISGDHEYVLPEHASMYKKNPSGVSYRFKSFLEELEIKTSKKIKLFCTFMVMQVI